MAQVRLVAFPLTEHTVSSTSHFLQALTGLFLIGLCIHLRPFCPVYHSLPTPRQPADDVAVHMIWRKCDYERNCIRGNMSMPRDNNPLCGQCTKEVAVTAQGDRTISPLGRQAGLHPRTHIAVGYRKP
jgi:hypothetical protein